MDPNFLRIKLKHINHALKQYQSVEILAPLIVEKKAIEEYLEQLYENDSLDPDAVFNWYFGPITHTSSRS